MTCKSDTVNRLNKDTLLPNNSVHIRKVSFGEREDGIYCEDLCALEGACPLYRASFNKKTKLIDEYKEML